MHTTDSAASAAPVVDQDLAEQARPGHGVPSQDPSPDAQYAIPPDEAERERKSVLAGGGVIVGAAAGAAVGSAVAGPLGVLVGGAVGAVAGAAGGAAAGPLATPTEEAAASVPEKPTSAL